MQTNIDTCDNTHENTHEDSHIAVIMPNWKMIYLWVFSKGAYQKLLKPKPGANYEIKFKNDPGYL